MRLDAKFWESGLFRPIRFAIHFGRTHGLKAIVPLPPFRVSVICDTCACPFYHEAEVEEIKYESYLSSYKFCRLMLENYNHLVELCTDDNLPVFR